MSGFDPTKYTQIVRKATQLTCCRREASSWAVSCATFSSACCSLLFCLKRYRRWLMRLRSRRAASCSAALTTGGRLLDCTCACRPPPYHTAAEEIHGEDERDYVTWSLIPTGCWSKHISEAARQDCMGCSMHLPPQCSITSCLDRCAAIKEFIKLECTSARMYMSAATHIVQHWLLSCCRPTVS